MATVVKARYRSNQAGLNALKRSRGMQRALETIAEAIAKVAEADAPVDTGRYKTGAPPHRTGGFKVSSGVENGHAYGRVSNDATDPESGYLYAWAPLEFSTENQPGQRILGKALEAVTHRRIRHSHGN